MDLPTTADDRLHALARAIEHLPASTMIEVGWIRQLVGMTNSVPEPELLDVPAIASMIDRSVSTARELCASGAIPGAFRLRGREWRASADDVRAFLYAERDRHAPAARRAIARPRGQQPLDSWRRVL